VLLRPAAGFAGLGLWRWVLPLAAAVAVVAALQWQQWPPGTAPELAGIKADRLQVNEHLVSSFDTVAELPTGEPVRFRVRQWQDRIVVNDKNRGLSVVEDRPRLEVVPVRFETY
jgi:anti-sigma-K factor RskA